MSIGEGKSTPTTSSGVASEYICTDAPLSLAPLLHCPFPLPLPLPSLLLLLIFFCNNYSFPTQAGPSTFILFNSLFLFFFFFTGLAVESSLVIAFYLE
jgi:hypothetical protein